MKKLLLLLAITVAWLDLHAAPTTAVAADEHSLRIDLMRTDAEFSWMSMRRSRAEAFLTYMAEDALLLNRGVRGREAARESFKSDPPGMRLSWGPTLADVSAAGDLGYTIGIWHRSIPQEGGKVSQFSGMFCTVWRWQPDGTWKFICDGGDAMPDEVIERIESSLRRAPPAPSVTPHGAADPVAWRKTLLETDRGRSRDTGLAPWTEGLIAAAANDVIFFEPAAHTRAAVAEALAKRSNNARAEWEPWTAEVAASGDLAITWGTWRLAPNDHATGETSTRGLYLTVWKRQNDGAWKSVVQLSPQSSPQVIATIRATANDAAPP